MKSVPSVAIEKYKFEICFINLIILSYLFRTAIPLLKFPFLLLYSCFIVYSLWNFRKGLVSKLREFVRNYYLLLFLAFILVISFLFSNKLYLTIFKDVVNMIILLSIFFMSTLIVRKKEELNYYVFNLVYLIVLFAFLISILGLLDFFDIYSYIDFTLDKVVSGSTTEDPISVDYNFALLPVFFGIVSIFYFLIKRNSKIKEIYFNILLLLFSLDIILSGSRRGLITFIGILVILLIAQFYSIYKKDGLLGKLGTTSKYFLLSVFLLSALSLYVTFKADYSFKVKLLEFIGSKNMSDTKEKVAMKLYKYTLIFGTHLPFPEFYSSIWPSIPEDPDSGWGTRIHKTIFPLFGKYVEIVPKKAKGYLMDSTCNPSYYTGINLCESFTLIVNLNVRKGERYKASVYCFVSENFDGNAVSFGNSDYSIENKIVSGNTHANYDLKIKGIWKKLEVEFECNDGGTPLLLSFIQNGVKDFSKLKGYVIFAYPSYKKINKTENLLPLNNIQSRGECTPIFVPDPNKNRLVPISHNTFTFLEKKVDIEGPQILTGKKIIDRTSISIIEYSSRTQYFLSGIYWFPLLVFSPSGLIKKDKDPVRKLASKFISEDTIYYPYKANIVLDTISNSFIGDRVSRWEFAFKIYIKEYNWKQKIFGGGFNFLNWFGFYFDRDKTRSDYPHNPFMSVLLYSGIFGLFFYVIFIAKVFYYYLKHYKDYKILSVFFIITFFFSFFSAGSPFDPPIMGFFVILPFFFHSILKNVKVGAI